MSNKNKIRIEALKETIKVIGFWVFLFGILWSFALLLNWIGIINIVK